MDEYDIINYINKFWKVRHYYDTAKGEGKKPKLIIGSDKDGCLTLFLNTDASLRRLGILLPETHPLFNHSTIWNARLRKVPASQIKYFIDQVQQFV
jgi:exopolysaccharide biosynthesis protein